MHAVVVDGVMVLLPPFVDGTSGIGMSTMLVLELLSRSSSGEMRVAAAVAVLTVLEDFTGDTMEPIGEAEVADTEEEGGVEVGAERLAVESGFANRTPSYWTPLNSIVTTSF